jgi:hypothetical protein
MKTPIAPLVVARCRACGGLLRVLAAGALAFLFAVATPPSAACADRTTPQTTNVQPGLIAHEWGTFTSVAGAGGQAIDWLPFTGSVDAPGFVHRDLLPLNGLPGFVYHTQTRLKFALRGTIRMETPVLYFYSNRDLALSVHVSFLRGLITEWYPAASQVTATEDVRGDTLYQKEMNGSLDWGPVTLEPRITPDLHRDDATVSRYYAARNTSSAPLRVSTAKGDEHEKFLFYRGVSAAPVPVMARSLENGGVAVTSLLKEDIPDMILFERRGRRLGFRLGAGLREEAIFDPVPPTGSVDSLAIQLEETLVARGLYRDEARAMLETWGDSWFEEGSRLIYIVPATYVNAVLPLNVEPIPQQTVRVFVGRMEILSPATLEAVEHALNSHDQETLRKYCRFLEPIMQIVSKKDQAQSEQIKEFFYESCR